MIYSDRQHNVSKSELAKLKAALETSLAKRGDKEAWLQQITIDALRSQIDEISSDISEYEMLREGQVGFTESCSLNELPRVLLQARISKGLSQTDLANILSMKPQQIQRYEATNYMSANLARLISVADALEVKISETYENFKPETSGAIFSWTDTNSIAWNKFPTKEMIRRKWITPRSDQSLGEMARAYFLTSAGPQFASAMHRKKFRGGNVPNEYSLLAWQARVLNLARNLYERNELNHFTLNDEWLSELVQLTRNNKGPALAQSLLAEHGIALIIERHLPGTYLDGAAMLSDFDNPIVALTLRYDRLDHFWFVLFHELGHLFLHLFKSHKFDFFDEEDGTSTDDIEKEADLFSLNTLIPETSWNRCLSRFALTTESVLIDSENLGVDASIIAGRIRKERGDYTIFNDLIGLNSVRSQFPELST